MELKRYQRSTLDALERFLARAAATGPAEAFAREVARQDAEDRARGGDPAPRAYRPHEADPDLPHVCLRLPTGGGKTLLAAESIRVAGRAFLGRDLPLTLWFVPSNVIKGQTLEALKDPAHPYRRRLDEVFGGRVRVFDVDAFETIRPQDIASSAVVVVSTIQAFRVGDTSGRRVYAHHEELEAHFAGLPADGMERVSAEDAAGSRGLLTEGAAKASFANLLFHHRPLMIVAEAHGAVTGLSREMQARLRPAAIVEFTATPHGLNNVLHSVTATALRDEEMIKLPIRVRPHASWKEAVSAAASTRRMLEEKAAGEREHLRPVALYQAQARNGHPTVEELRAYLADEVHVPADRIKVATGEQRELDGVDLSDPAEPTRHVITVQALKEGWDCPSAYVLCATQRLSAAAAVEQLLGRVLRMPYARRRADAALNMAYAHVSEPSFADAAQALRGKLIDMGFTDEEVRQSVRPRSTEADANGDLFDPDPVDPKPVLNVTVPDGEAVREALNGLAEAGVEYVARPDGTLQVGFKGLVSDEAAAAAEAVIPEADRSAFRQRLERHRGEVEWRRSPAEKGEVIEVPLLLAAMDGEVFEASGDAIFERTDWSLGGAPAEITERELRFDRSEQVVEIDLEGERLVYRQQSHAQPRLTGLADPAPDAMRTSLIRWLERECRMPDVLADELRAWLAAVVARLESREALRTLVDWQHVIAARLRGKIDAAREAARQSAWQRTLFDLEPPAPSEDAPVVRFGQGSYADVATTPTGALRLNKHLLGPDRAPLTDGTFAGDEFQCAVALDNTPEVEVWVRNIARHRDSFSLPRASGRFFPDFVARLAGGRILVVEYKGEHLVTAAEAREKDALGRLWAERTGNVFLMVRKEAGGIDMSGQIANAVAQ